MNSLGGFFMDYKYDLEQKRKEALKLIDEWDRKLKMENELIESQNYQNTENAHKKGSVKREF